MHALICKHFVSSFTFFLILGSKPELKDLFNVVTPDYSANWREIGESLGLKVGELNAIDHDHHHRAVDCCDAVWEKWLEIDSSASWNKVIQSTESLDPRNYAVDSAVTVLTVNHNSISVVVQGVTDRLQKHFIIERYKNSDDDWPSYQPDHFTSVALIHHREKHATEKEIITISKQQHKGEINEDFKKDECSKSIKSISDIFTPQCFGENETNFVRPNVILIEGAPGIGKTILSKEIAYQWANKTLLQEKKMVFLVFLRDPYVQQIVSFEQFICYVTHSYHKNSTVEAVMEHLESTSGEDCTIIFDGYDEISEDIRNNSLIEKIISHKILNLCALVITSRPVASARLHNVADCRVEVLGFTKEDRTAYISKSLQGDVNEIAMMQKYLESNSFIDSLCYIPLNMTILLCLFKESFDSDAKLPKTQTEINKQFVHITILRHIRKKHGISVKGRLLQDLPSPYKQQLIYLSKLAYKFLGKNIVVFNNDDIIRECPKDSEKLNTLGLLKVVKYRTYFDTELSISYNFLHLSVQEFLAAFYITSLTSNSKQIRKLQKKLLESTISQYQYYVCRINWRKHICFKAFFVWAQLSMAY